MATKKEVINECNVLCFPTKYTEREKVKTNAGSRMIPQYKLKVHDNGVRELRKEEDKFIDGYAQIQSYKDSVDINYILARFARGDVSALSRIQGVYGDFTEVPKTLAEVAQRAIDAENIFYQLPLETRQKFNHSPSEFYASIGTEKFNSLFSDEVKTTENTNFQPSGQDTVVTEQIKEVSNE